MSSSLQIAQSRLLLPAGLDTQGLDRTFGSLLGPGIDFGDLYFQHSRRESWTVEDGIVKEGAHSIEQGVGVRAISGEKTGFAYSDDINAEALLSAAQSARAISRDGRSHAQGTLAPGAGRSLYPAQDPIDVLGNEAKVEALRRVDKLLRALDPRVQQVVVGLTGGVDTVLVARSDGVLAGDVRPLVRLNVQVIVEHNGRRESGYAGYGGRYSYAELLGEEESPVSLLRLRERPEAGLPGMPGAECVGRGAGIVRRRSDPRDRTRSRPRRRHVCRGAEAGGRNAPVAQERSEPP